MNDINVTLIKAFFFLLYITDIHHEAILAAFYHLYKGRGLVLNNVRATAIYYINTSNIYILLNYLTRNYHSIESNYVKNMEIMNVFLIFYDKLIF